MNKRKKIRDSLLSLLCIISLLVIVYRIFSSVNIDEELKWFIRVYFSVFGLGIGGGVVLLLLATLKKTQLKQRFVYNFFGTFNLFTGFCGMIFISPASGPPPYTITASLAVGLAMYMNIYGARFVKFPNSIRRN